MTVVVAAAAENKIVAGATVVVAEMVDITTVVNIINLRIMEAAATPRININPANTNFGFINLRDALGGATVAEPVALDLAVTTATSSGSET